MILARLTDGASLQAIGEGWAHNTSMLPPFLSTFSRYKIHTPDAEALSAPPPTRCFVVEKKRTEYPD